MRKDTADKKLKIVFIFCAATPLTAVPAYLMATDWWRWHPAVICAQFILAFFFIYVEESAAVEAGKAMAAFIEKYKFVCLAVLVYLALLGRFDATAGGSLKIDLKIAQYAASFFGWEIPPLFSSGLIPRRLRREMKTDRIRT